MNKEFEQNINELNFISKRIEKDNPKQSSFGGAATGAVIGSLIAPGIGTILGGAIGKCLTGANNESKDGLQPFKGLEEDTKHEIREYYQIPRNEEILFVSTEENERVVITENQLIWDDSTEEGQFYHILWGNIKKVYYQEGQFIVQTLDETEGSIPAVFFWGMTALGKLEKPIGSNNRIASILLRGQGAVGTQGGQGGVRPMLGQLRERLGLGRREQGEEHVGKLRPLRRGHGIHPAPEAVGLPLGLPGPAGEKAKGPAVDLPGKGVVLACRPVAMALDGPGPWVLVEQGPDQRGLGDVGHDAGGQPAIGRRVGQVPVKAGAVVAVHHEDTPPEERRGVDRGPHRQVPALGVAAQTELAGIFRRHAHQVVQCQPL